MKLPGKFTPLGLYSGRYNFENCPRLYYNFLLDKKITPHKIMVSCHLSSYNVPGSLPPILPTRNTQRACPRLKHGDVFIGNLNLKLR